MKMPVGSATLWWLAKKRQWDIRSSIRRASRRITGRGDTDNKDRQSHRRTGIRLNSPPPGNKGREGGDLEKGVRVKGEGMKTTTTISSVRK